MDNSWKEEGIRMKYFVLKPEGNNEHARASRMAMLAYADSIWQTAPVLAQEIREWAFMEEGKSRAAMSG